MIKKMIAISLNVQGVMGYLKSLPLHLFDNSQLDVAMIQETMVCRQKAKGRFLPNSQ